MSASRTPGIFYGWIVVACAFMVMFVGFGAAYSFSAFFPALEAEFGSSRGDTSLVFAFAGFLYFTLGAVSGPIADKTGPRLVSAFGMVLVALGLVISSRLASLPAIILVYGLLIGFGVGFSYVPAVGMVQRWFTRRRGLASGMAVAGIGVATVVMPAVSVEMIELVGWRQTYLWFGVAAAALGLLASFFMVHSPAQMGLNPEGDAAPPPGHLEGVSVLDAVMSKPFFLIYFAAVLLSFGLFIPFAHFLNYLTDIGVGGETAAQVFGMIGVGSIAGRFLLSGIADKFGRRRSLAAMFLGITLIYFVWLLSENVWLLGAFGLIFGICYGGFVALAPAIAADYFGARKAATIIGILYTGPGLGNLVGPVLAGYAFDASGTYVVPIIAAIATSALGTVLLFLLPNPADWRELARRSGLMLAS